MPLTKISFGVYCLINLPAESWSIKPMISSSSTIPFKVISTKSTEGLGDNTISNATSSSTSFSSTTIDNEVESVKPSPSVTVKTTSYVPAASNSNSVSASNTMLPSPKFHSYETIPLSSIELLPVNDTVSGASPVTTSELATATGASLNYPLQRILKAVLHLI